MNVKDNSMAIIIFCSHLCTSKGVKPLSPKEWSKLASILMKQNIQPSELLEFSYDDFSNKLLLGKEQIDRLQKLISRSGSIAFELQKIYNVGINIVTRADLQYPAHLKNILGNSCPPLFYSAGNLDLVNHKLIGFVGSRNITEIDLHFTQKMVQKAISKGFGIVSGGAKGIDSIARDEALNNNGMIVEFISDSLIKKIKDIKIINAVRKGQFLLLSVAKPDAGFSTGIAMMRNKYIYANSVGTVVVKSDFNKGGTWAGANDNLKMNWSKEFCWKNISYKGNIELIKNGATPIDENWDFDFEIIKKTQNKKSEQMSIFDFS